MTRTKKMPGLSYSLPAWECITGAKLRKVKGSVCAGCYALKGNYTRYPAIKAAQWLMTEYGPINNPNATFYKGDHWGGCNVDVIDQFIRLNHINSDTNYINFVENIVSYFKQINIMRQTGEPMLIHSYVLSAYLGGMAMLAHEKQDYIGLAFVENIWKKLVKDHLYPTGSLGFTEFLSETSPNDIPITNNTYRRSHQETCATVEWMYLSKRLYEASGNVRYIHALENTIYNALLAAQSDDGMKWMYFTPLRYEKNWFSGGTRCCYFSGPRGIAMIPEIIYSQKEKEIDVNLFESSHVELYLKNKKIIINQETTYPDSGYTRFAFKLDDTLNFAFRIRYPEWVDDVKVTINNNRISVHDEPGQYNYMKEKGMKWNSDRTWADGDVVEISFDMPTYLRDMKKTGVTFTKNWGVIVFRGPEAMAVDSRDNESIDLDLIQIPNNIILLKVGLKKGRRIYKGNVLYKGKMQELFFTPYADAGNDQAKFRTVFPRFCKSE